MTAERDVCGGCRQRPCVCETVVLPTAEKGLPALRTVEVVTRYGGHRHLAETSFVSRATGRLFTICRSTSAWTIDSWRVTPDHPLGLTPEAMEQLPLCEVCQSACPIPPVSGSPS